MERGFSVSESLLLVSMSKFLRSYKFDFDLKDLSENLQVAPSDPRLRKILTYLFENDIANVKRIIGNSKLLTINQKQLNDLIDELPLTNEFYNYFKEVHICSWRPLL